MVEIVKIVRVAGVVGRARYEGECATQQECLTSSGKLHAPLVPATGHAVYIEVGYCLMQ